MIYNRFPPDFQVFCKDSDCRVMVDGSELVQLSDFADEYPS